MAITAQDYAQSAVKLLPQGLAWTRDLNSELVNVATLRDTALAQVNETAHQLLSERILQNANLLLSDWEKCYGLPQCGHGEDLSIYERQQALAFKDAMVGSFNDRYLVELAKLHGFNIQIERRLPHNCIRDCTYPLHPTENAYRVFVHCEEGSVKNWVIGSSINEPLKIYNRSEVECIFKRIAYAHLEVIFIYKQQED